MDPSDNSVDFQTLWALVDDLEAGVSGTATTRYRFMALVQALVSQQAQIDALTARLYGDPDSGGTDGGEVGRLQRDVKTRYVEAVERLDARIDILGSLVARLVTEQSAAQPHRQTSDEQHTYSVATS